MFTSLFNVIVKAIKSVKGFFNFKHRDNFKPVNDVWVDEEKIVIGTEKFEWTKWFTGEYRFVDNVRRKALEKTHSTNVKIYCSVGAVCSIASIVMLVTGQFYGAFLAGVAGLIFEGIAVVMTGLKAKKIFFAA